VRADVVVGVVRVVAAAVVLFGKGVSDRHGDAE